MYAIRSYYEYEEIYFSTADENTEISRPIDPHPFVPSSVNERASRCEAILKMQSLGLKKRLNHTNAKSLVIGISGGLDSCLALLVAANAIDMLNRKRTDIIAVTIVITSYSIHYTKLYDLGH